MHQWGLGAVQEIDAAAMSVWLSYRHMDADATFLNSSHNRWGASRCNASEVYCVGSSETKVKFDPMQIVKFGALINF